MKIIIAFAVLIVGISAFPNFQQVDLKNERFVTDSIASAIQDASQSIKDAGLDPYYIESNNGTTALPVDILFSTTGEIEELMFQGLSNIIINRLSFSIITYRLTFNIELPSIQLSAKKADCVVVLFGKEYSASASGSLTISRLRIDGYVRVRVGIVTGINLRSLSMNFSLGGITSEMDVTVQNWDFSNSLNTFLGTTIPNTINEYSSEINELIEYYATNIIEANL